MNRQPLLRWQSKLFRVVRRGWRNPLDSSFSRSAPDRRWNTESFEALYCCGSESVARAVVRDVFRLAGVVPADLTAEARPQLVELEWSGAVADLYTRDGVEGNGFPASYPHGVTKQDTRRAAAGWHEAGVEGVCCRSASLARMGQSVWPERIPYGSEVALWPANWRRPPKLMRRRNDERWLRPPAVAG